MPRSFHLGDILTCTTGSMLSPTGDDGVKNLVEYVSGMGHPGSTIVLAREFVGRALIEQHHFLLTLKPRSTDPDGLRAFLTYAVENHGEHHDVEPIADQSYVPYGIFKIIAEGLFAKLRDPSHPDAGHPDGP